MCPLTTKAKHAVLLGTHPNVGSFETDCIINLNNLTNPEKMTHLVSQSQSGLNRHFRIIFAASLTQPRQRNHHHTVDSNKNTNTTTTKQQQTMRVELSVHATKLKNVAGAMKGTSDPFAVVTLMPSAPGEKPRVIGKTEVIKNNLNPQWVTSFELDYELGTPCKVAINIFDEVRKGDNKAMGSTTFEVGEVLGTLVFDRRGLIRLQ